MSSVNLKPCPHCGGNASMSIDPEATTDWMGRRWAFTVVCENCCATSGLHFSEENAAESWNRRAAAEQPRWIPATELPPNDTDVLLCRGEECVVGRWFTEDEEYGPYWISNADFDGWHMNASELPTHWQPLPAPPTPDECSAVRKEE